MVIQAKITKEGLIRPLNKISLPQGIEFSIIINLPKVNKIAPKKIKRSQGLGTLKAISKINAKGGPKDLSENIDKYLYGNYPL